MERLQKYIASCGVASRRKAEELITEGKVQVNGRKVTELGIKINPQKDKVKVNGQLLAQEKPVYYLLNKPKGVITSVSKSIVTGPSFLMSTFISAPKIPVSTFNPVSFIISINLS